ncbi:MAG TPA: transglutaminase-like domain-containing protein [Candidatus Saccharimonadales bacterium]|nr:transglutaminase-like domain-containing protein [Candidatus Saccharimonadales bacterium]
MKVTANPEAVKAFAAEVRPELEDDQLDLLRAALAMARVEYPLLDAEVYVRKVEQLARRVSALVREPGDPQQSIAAVNRVLFDEEMFRGNTVDYYNPRNSFLNDVLDRRLGIPITLALVYMEVGRRAGFPLLGVGFPGHFLLKHYEVSGKALLIDAFERGKIVTEADCQQRLDTQYSGQLNLQPEFLMAVTRRQMLTRILNNLRTVYLSQRNFRKAVQIVDLVLVIYPRSPEDVKQRALLRHNLQDYRGALADFEDYVNMLPDASDAEEIRQAARALRRTLASMN